MIEDFAIRQIALDYLPEKETLTGFLARHQLHYEEDIDIAFGVFTLDDRLVGCGCAAGSLMKCFAVDEELRGQNALGPLVSRLMQDRFAAGFYELAVITRAHNRELFANCGLYPVAEAAGLVMLENRPRGPEAFAAKLRRPGDEGKRIGAVVMNCNPFTRGHRALVEYAAAHCDILHLFVVETDHSCFPTAVRLRLVQEGVADLPNVRVSLSGRYMISAATFPTYFLKKDEDATSLQAALDITIFARRLAPALGVTVRFAGQEPTDGTTARYNAAMAAILPEAGVEFCEIPRICGAEGEVISASRLRRILQEKGVCPEALSLVPPTTARYLQEEYRP